MDHTLFICTSMLSALLCSLVAGFLFAFAVVAMPGLKHLHDRDFIRAFQVIDGVIQNKQPVFMAVWIGSVPAVIASVLMGWRLVDDHRHLLLIAAALTYVFAVQLPTILINIPLNNRLQALDVDMLNETTLKTARRDFEQPWNRWNAIRTLFAILTSLLLIGFLYQL